MGSCATMSDKGLNYAVIQVLARESATGPLDTTHYLNYQVLIFIRMVDLLHDCLFYM